MNLVRDLIFEGKASEIQIEILVKYLKKFEPDTDWEHKSIVEMVNSDKYNNLCKEYGKKNNSIYKKE